MRRRLTAVIALFGLLLVLGALTARAAVLVQTHRAETAELAQADADLLAAALLPALRDGLTQGEVADVTPPHAKVEVTVRGVVSPVVAEGPQYAVNEGARLAASASLAGGRGTVMVFHHEPSLVQSVPGGLGSIWALLVIVSLLSLGGAWLVAGWATRPLRLLAAAAEGAGRGRSDVRLPRTRDPQVRAIAQALERGSRETGLRLAREREFAEIASHELRTPLTKLRLELEQVGLDPLSDDQEISVRRSLDAVSALEVVAGRLVGETKASSLLIGAEEPLHLVTAKAAQRWAQRLGSRAASFSAAVEGDLDLVITPGPVEQVLDGLLGEVMRRARGETRLICRGEADGYLRVRAQWSSSRIVDTGLAEDLTASVAALGGRLTVAPDARSIEVLLPRR